MTTAWALLGVTLVLAVLDWIAIALRRRDWEMVLKPAVMVALAAFVWWLPASPVDRTWPLAAIGLSLLGDVFLVLPDDRSGRLFLGGLAAFLLAHVAYTIGLAKLGPTATGLTIGGALGLLLLLTAGRHIARAAAQRSRVLANAVVAYMLVIAAMLTAAWGTGLWTAALGASLFCASDAVLGWTRFVAPLPARRLAIMIPYHLGQIGLALSLVEAAWH